MLHLLAVVRAWMHGKFVCVYLIGLAFWKCVRRKVYAVLQNDDSTSEEEDGAHDNSDLRPHSRADRWTKLLDKVEAIGHDIDDIKSSTRDSKANLPLRLQRDIPDVFKCSICHGSPLRPPVIIAKCYKNIIGCEECINTWYNGENAMTKTCPLCRADRGYAETMRLNGLEGFY